MCVFGCFLCSFFWNRINILLLLYLYVYICICICIWIYCSFIINLIFIYMLLYYQIHFIQYHLMRYSKSLFREAISQWRDCYIDYQFLKIFVMVIHRIMSEVNQIQEKIDQHHKNSEKKSSQQSAQQFLTVDQVLYLNDTVYRLKIIVADIHLLFNKAFQSQVNICDIFCVIKFYEVLNRHSITLPFSYIANSEDREKILVPYIQYTYIQTVYLKKMIQSNLQAQRKILKKHKKYVQGTIQTHDPVIQKQFKKYEKKTDEMKDKIQNFYIEIRTNIEKQKKAKKTKSKAKRDYIRNLAVKAETTNKDSFTFGLWVGIFSAVIIFMSLLMAYKNKSVQNDPVFNRDFPTWRGIAFIILYIWTIGVNVYYFEKYMISHNIIFGFTQHHHSTSTQIFKVAGVFSTIFAALFTVYALHASQIINLLVFPAKYLVLFVWGLFILVMLNPLPVLYYRSRFFVIKTLARIVISPCVGVPFIIAWATDQLVSLITPFEDLTYTICYYTYLDFSDLEVKNNRCKNPARIAVFAYSATVLFYRIIQCIRQGYDKKKYFRQFEFYNTLKYLASLLTLILSFLWRGGNSNIFAAWLTFTIISTIYSYSWDLKVDWGLLDKNADHCLLRNKINYAPYIYYIVMVGNLALRLAWVLTLSPNIAETTFGSAEIFRLVTGAIEIFRRGMWNLLRIQKEHLKNREQFIAIPKIRNTYECKIKQTLKQSKQKFQSIERLSHEQLQMQAGKIVPDNIETMENLKKQVQLNQKLKKQLYQNLLQKQKQADEIIKNQKNFKN